MERISFGIQAARACWKKSTSLLTEPERLWAQNSEPVATSSLFTPEITWSVYRIHNCCDGIDFSTAPWCVPMVLNQLNHENEALLKKQSNIPNYEMKSPCHFSSQSDILSGFVGLIYWNKLGTNMWDMNTHSEAECKITRFLRNKVSKTNSNPGSITNSPLRLPHPFIVLPSAT